MLSLHAALAKVTAYFLAACCRAMIVMLDLCMLPQVLRAGSVPIWANVAQLVNCLPLVLCSRQCELACMLL